jgi:hypothetical protein
MFTTKIIASLFLIAAAGMVDAERGRSTLGAEAPPGGAAARAATAPAAVPTEAAPVRAAVLAALSARVRADLADPSVTVALDRIALGTPNGAIVAADGGARISLGAGGVLPVHYDADWNPATGELERLDYRVVGAAAPAATASAAARARPALGATLRAAISDKLGAALGQEFSGQHSRFELLGVDRVESGRRRMVVTGTGITRFDGEGAAFTRFSASLDKFDGRVLHVDYDLLQDVDPRTLAAR